MKPVYKCDYCSYMGTEEEVEKHEPKCFDNYDMKSCHTCKHKDVVGSSVKDTSYKCKVGIDIPAKHVYRFCNYYERRETRYDDSLINFADSLFWFKH